MPRVPTWIYFCDSSAMLPLPFAHIAGIPVEETLLSFGPVFAVAGGAAGVWVRARIADAKRRLRREAE